MINIISATNLTEVYNEDSDLLPNEITMGEAEHLIGLNDEDDIYAPTATLEDNVLTIYGGLEEDCGGIWGHDLQCEPVRFLVA